MEKRRDPGNETLVEIQIYFEGNRTLRGSFDSFFSELRKLAREAGSTIELVAAKDGPSAYGKATRTHPQAWNILLKDSEQAVPTNPSQLCERHGINPAFVDRVFWMVELMEAWYLADPEALAGFYGQGFRTNAIGNTEDVERVPKAEVMNRLREATTNTSKGRYDKVKHAPYLLERLDSGRVQRRARNCRQLFDSVRNKFS
jgi:hypothetical protein